MVGEKRGKGSRDPIQVYNQFGSLDGADVDIQESTSQPGSRSGSPVKKNSSRPTIPPKSQRVKSATSKKESAKTPSGESSPPLADVQGNDEMEC
jgi:hypothetical protein